MCLLYVYVIWQYSYPFCALTYTRPYLVQCTPQEGMDQVLQSGCYLEAILPHAGV